MAANSGKSFLVRLKDNSASPAFFAVAGMRTKQLDINNEIVDITNSDSVLQFREILDGNGVASMSASGSGVLNDKVTHGEIVEAAIDRTLRDGEITVPGLGKFTGKFRVSKYSGKGEYNGAVMFDLSLESSGVITFTLEP